MLLRAQLEDSADYNVSSLFTKSGEFRNATSSREEMTSIRKQVTNALRHAIIEGTFLPGQELNDGLLCRHFGVSRTTMREALRYLEAERLIVVKTNRRTYVCCPNMEESQKIYHLLGVLFGQALVNIACSIRGK
jgi:DNA-binding GntR family transcriptional regulator